MTEELHLANPPIVEMVVDIECDLPSAYLTNIDRGMTQAFGSSYPTGRRVHARKKETQPVGDRGRLSPQVAGLQFVTSDDRQVVQMRQGGYSFNRLAPYTNLDDYLPEIQRTWTIFRDLAAPLQVRTIRLRFINRISLPLTEGRVSLTDYLRVAPELPDEGLAFSSFLNQHSAFEFSTGNEAKITLASQPLKDAMAPIILDIETSDPRPKAPDDWVRMNDGILALRALANRVFAGALTDKCLNLFQQP